MFYDQSGFDARFEWGIEGLRLLGPSSDVLIIVDVLSFSTAVDVAVGRGARVLPYRRHDETAGTLVRDTSAILAGVIRQSTDDQPFTLSPSSLETIPHGALLVLPSLNGATLSHLASEMQTVVFTGCLRNATALATAARAAGGAVTVVAAGERWGNDSLRPAVEDLIGGGAILAALKPATPSAEARIAIAAFQSAEADLLYVLQQCSSGRELLERGFERDVELAAQLDISTVAPVLRDNTFVDWMG